MASKEREIGNLGYIFLSLRQIKEQERLCHSTVGWVVYEWVLLDWIKKETSWVPFESQFFLN